MIPGTRGVFGYHPLYQFLLMGVCGAFLTGDLFNLYVWFEVVLMASFVLMALGGERGQMEGAIKYVALNLVSSAMFLSALGLLYGMAGTLNMADLAQKFSVNPPTQSPDLVTAVAMPFMVAFGIKAAVFPLFFWLPASYHTPPAAVSALFAGLLTKMGVYALIRVFTLIFLQDIGYTRSLLLIIAALTMISGMLGAAVQKEFRRVLSFLTISHIGYMIMGLGLFTPLAGAVFMLLAAIGMVRMPDVLTRLHRSTKSATLGVGLIMLGVAQTFSDFGIGVCAFAIVIFLFVTVPVAAHMIARAAYLSGVPLWDGTLSDELRGRYDPDTHILSGEWQSE